MIPDLLELFNEMLAEENAAMAVYKEHISNGGDKFNMPLAIGEAYGYSKALSEYSDKLNAIITDGDNKLKLKVIAFRKMMSEASTTELLELLKLREVANKVARENIKVFNNDAVEAMTDTIISLWWFSRKYHELKNGIITDKVIISLELPYNQVATLRSHNCNITVKCVDINDLSLNDLVRSVRNNPYIPSVWIDYETRTTITDSRIINGCVNGWNCARDKAVTIALDISTDQNVAPDMCTPILLPYYKVQATLEATEVVFNNFVNKHITADGTIKSNGHLIGIAGSIMSKLFEIKTSK
jgi:hypothetical protein